MAHDKKMNLKKYLSDDRYLSFRMCGIYVDLSVTFDDQKVVALQCHRRVTRLYVRTKYDTFIV